MQVSVKYPKAVVAVFLLCAAASLASPSYAGSSSCKYKPERCLEKQKRKAAQEAEKLAAMQLAESTGISQAQAIAAVRGCSESSENCTQVVTKHIAKQAEAMAINQLIGMTGMTEAEAAQQMFGCGSADACESMALSKATDYTQDLVNDLIASNPDLSLEMANELAGMCKQGIDKCQQKIQKQMVKQAEQMAISELARETGMSRPEAAKLLSGCMQGGDKCAAMAEEMATQYLEQEAANQLLLATGFRISDVEALQASYESYSKIFDFAKIFSSSGFSSSFEYGPGSRMANDTIRDTKALLAEKNLYNPSQDASTYYGSNNIDLTKKIKDLGI